MKKSFVRVTNRGNVVKVVREHYLRDDIPCGVLGCSQCQSILEQMPSSPVLLDPLNHPSANGLFPEKSVLVLPDTNLLLHNLDVFESERFTDAIILQTVLDEVRHRNMGLYSRVRSMTTQPGKRFFVFSNEFHKATHIERREGESDNDRNDRAIRSAVRWYQDHLGKGISVVLLSNDAGNRERAVSEDGIDPSRVLPLYAFVEGFGDNQLLDVMEKTRLEDIAEEGDKEQYQEHQAQAVLAAGVKAGKYHQGTLHCSPYNPFEGSIGSGLEKSDLKTISISGRMRMNRAVNGDTVVVEVLPREQWTVKEGEKMDREAVSGDSPIVPAEEESAPVRISQAQGRVVGIIRRSGRAYCGSIDRRSIRPNQPIQNVLFISMDRRIPRIRIRTRQADHLLSQRIIVSIDEWPQTSRYPSGHLVRILGAAGDRATETEAILLEHDVAYVDFTPQVLACLPSPDWTPLPEDYSKRADFRHLDVCSVDPPGCTDIDDALHARRLENGNLEIGVHIADVTHFVGPDTPLDREASSRATTVYLVDKRIDMLPGLLGTNLCSLKSHVERFAFSVLWEMTDDARVIGVRFTKSVIASKASLTYDQAQARLDDPNATDPISLSLKTLNSLAQILRQRRIDGGALTLASPEVRFNLDTDTQNPVDVELKEMKAANSMVEEFMLLANIHVAEKLFSAFPDNAILRRHPAPPAENFVALNRALEGLSQSALDCSSSRALADSLDRINVPGDPFLNRLIRIMTTRCMQQAVYFASGTQPYNLFWHYGLACPIYTHFTSPIRRYADVLVHRLLAAAIDWAAPTSISWTKQQLDECCHNLNYRNRMAQQAQRSSVELFTHLFFKDKTVIEDAYVIRIMQNGFVALIPTFGIEGVIALGDKQLEELEYDNVNSRFLEKSTGSVKIHLFGKLRVRAVVEENEATGRPKLRFTVEEGVDQGHPSAGSNKRLKP